MGVSFALIMREAVGKSQAQRPLPTVLSAIQGALGDAVIVIFPDGAALGLFHHIHFHHADTGGAVAAAHGGGVGAGR
jgi:hypothetical protein